MPPAGIEIAVPEGKWPHTHTLKRAAAGLGIHYILYLKTIKGLVKFMLCFTI